ncbi:MAG: hypothetical protein GY803_22210 [Chloroflexi bacterium]|nr:hypothetical protein [Chloroflexota bacterium]
MGAQPFASFDDAYAPVADLEVTGGEHPIMAGLTDGDVFDLLASDSGVPATVLSADDYVPFGEDDKVDFVLSRGPGSEESGSPVMIVSETTYNRFVLASFSFYRLPEDVQQTLAVNIVEWLMAAGAE